MVVDTDRIGSDQIGSDQIRSDHQSDTHRLRDDLDRFDRASHEPMVGGQKNTSLFFRAVLRYISNKLRIYTCVTLYISTFTDIYLEKTKKFREKANFARPRSRDPDIAARPYCARLEERKTKTILFCHAPLQDAPKRRKSRISIFSLESKNANLLSTET